MSFLYLYDLSFSVTPDTTTGLFEAHHCSAQQLANMLRLAGACPLWVRAGRRRRRLPSSVTPCDVRDSATVAANRSVEPVGPRHMPTDADVRYL